MESQFALVPVETFSLSASIARSLASRAERANANGPGIDCPARSSIRCCYPFWRSAHQAGVRRKPQLAVSGCPGGSESLPAEVTQTSPWKTPGIGLADLVVSPVTAPVAVASVSVVGQSEPLPIVGAPKVVVFPFVHVMVPPAKRVDVLNFCEDPPVLPL